MNKRKLKVLYHVVSFVLVVIMTLPFLSPLSVHAEEANSSITVQEKMDLLLERLGVQSGKNTYFTINQQACSSIRQSGHGCSNCSTGNIVQATWFKNIWGNISTSLFPSHDVNASRRDNSGQSCFGFACFAQWYVYADSSTENLEGQRVATITFNQTNIMNYVKPGDVLRVNGHSVLVYAVESTGITVIDCNWNMGGQLNCVVQKHLIPYTNSTCAGYTTYVNRVTKTSTLPEGMAGIFDVTKYSTPESPVYGTLDLSGTSWSAYNVGLNVEMYADKEYTIYPGALLKILGTYVNSKGNTIYHVYSYDLQMECYVAAKFVKINDTPEAVYGTLDLSGTSWSAYNVGLNVEMYADKEYTIYPGAFLKILGTYVNSKGNTVYHVYSYDLQMECYVTAKYVKIIQ